MCRFVCRIISLKWNFWTKGFRQFFFYRGYAHVYSDQQCMYKFLFQYLIRLSEFYLLGAKKHRKYLSLVFICNYLFYYECEHLSTFKAIYVFFLLSVHDICPSFCCVVDLFPNYSKELYA